MRSGDPPPDAPVLVACAHGTRDPAGRRAMARLRLEVAARRPGIQVLAANVDVQKPALPDVAARLVDAGRCFVVVPLLLSAGYHVHVDIADLVGAVTSAGGAAVAAPALGPDDALVEVLLDRLAERDVAPDRPVVLGAAGSSDPRALDDVATVARALAARRGAPVTPGYLSAARPTIAEALAAARSNAGPQAVAVATFLLAPGFFADRLAACGAATVTSPLAPHPLLADVVLRRYDEAVAGSPLLTAHSVR